MPNEAKDALNGGKTVSKLRNLALISQEAPEVPLVSVCFLNDQKSLQSEPTQSLALP